MFGNQAAQNTRRLLLLLLTGALVAALATPLVAQDAPTGWATDTPSVLIVEARPYDGQTAFVLRNATDKDITAVAVSYEGTTRTIDSFGSDRSLSPGATWSFSIGNREIPRIGPVLHVSAVIFADGSWEGDEEQVLYRGGWRLGLVTETERVKDIIEGLTVEEPSDADIEDLKLRIGNLPGSTEEAVASVSGVRLPGLDINSVRSADKWLRWGVRSGIHSARDRALGQMHRLANLPRSKPGAAQTLIERAHSRAGSFAGLREAYRARSARNHERLQQVPSFVGPDVQEQHQQ